MKVLLATASEEIDKYIKENAVNYEVIGEIPYRKPLVSKAQELKPDVLVLSLLLPGEEDIREIVFETQRVSNCRIVLLTGNQHREAVITDMFFLGVRDFIPDPIQPKLLLQSIIIPATYSESVKHMKKVPGRESGRLTSIIQNILPKDKPESIAEIPEQTRLMINGIMALLNRTPARTLDENLLLIEQGIGELLIKKARDIL